jgi:hypothetical protein
VEQAESVVIGAIELWTPGDNVEDALTRYVIDRSVQAREPVDIRPASEILSEELRPVLKLAGARRHCFVLRVLANLSRHACACILGLTSLQVDRYTSAALANWGELRE